MSLFKIAWRSIQQRPLSSSLTCTAMALGVALVVAVLVTHQVVSDSFTRNTSLGYHLVVGGKNGSKMELVLSTVYHLGMPDQPLPWWYYKEFTAGKFAERVLLAVPICLGDNYQGYRVVATTPQYFEFQYDADRTYEFVKGRNFDAAAPWEAVIGAEVARRTGLAVGQRFSPSHGITTADKEHDEAFTVVGVLRRTGTPTDRALFVNVEGFFLMEGHDEGVAEHRRRRPGDRQSEAQQNEPPTGHDDRAPNDDQQHDPPQTASDVRARDDAPADRLPEERRGVTAVLVLAGSRNPLLAGFAGDMYAMQLHTEINRDIEAQAERPVEAVTKLLNQFVTPMHGLLLSLTVLTVVVAGVGVMVGIYNTMSGRRHEIAVLRALGAGRATVMTIVLLESILLSLLGGLAGIVLGHGIVAVASPLIVSYTGVDVGPLQYSPLELFVLPGLIALATLVGYLPAVAAYRTDVVKGLQAVQ